VHGFLEKAIIIYLDKNFPASMETVSINVFSKPAAGSFSEPFECRSDFKDLNKLYSVPQNLLILAF
jgi:hypothetical protein